MGTASGVSEHFAAEKTWDCDGSELFVRIDFEFVACKLFKYVLVKIEPKEIERTACTKCGIYYITDTIYMKVIILIVDKHVDLNYFS